MSPIKPVTKRCLRAWPRVHLGFASAHMCMLWKSKTLSCVIQYSSENKIHYEKFGCATRCKYQRANATRWGSTHSSCTLCKELGCGVSSCCMRMMLERRTPKMYSLTRRLICGFLWNSLIRVSSATGVRTGRSWPIGLRTWMFLFRTIFGAIIQTKHDLSDVRLGNAKPYLARAFPSTAWYIVCN